MQLDMLLKNCTEIICSFANKNFLQEFELLAYEQACRTLESILKDFRQTWEVLNDESDDYP